MKNKCLQLFPFVVILAVAFYLLPYLIMGILSALLLMLMVIPLIVIGCGAVYGKRNGFDLWLCLLTAGLFAPSLALHFNFTAWPYIVAYSLLSLIATLVGSLLRRNK